MNKLTVIYMIPAHILKMNLSRNTKSGSKWTPNDLCAFNINVTNVDETEFFNGHQLSDTTLTVPQVILEDPDIHDEHRQMFHSYLNLAMQLRRNRESAVDDFAKEVLTILGFGGHGRVICSRYSIELFMCGDYTTAETDICVIDEEYKIIFLIQENKAHIDRELGTRGLNPEAQFIAECIAAFQHNNAIRSELKIELRTTETFYGAVMIGTYPTFYKVPVTSDLNTAIKFGQYPTISTTVQRYDPIEGLERYSVGMKPISNRIKILKCYSLIRDILYGF